MTKSAQSKRRYDLIVWDWDGTIMDSTPTIVNCIQQACRDLGFKEPDDTLASSVTMLNELNFFKQLNEAISCYG